MMNGGDDVLARDGDRFHFLGAEEKPDIDEKLLGKHFGNRYNDHAVLLRDRKNRQLKSRGLRNHIQNRRVNMERVEVYHCQVSIIPLRENPTPKIEQKEGVSQAFFANIQNGRSF